MTREEQLVFCKKCTNRTLDMQQGMLCNLTGLKADFAPTCSNYTLDTSIEERLNDDKHLQREDMITLVSDENLAKIKAEQNLPAAIFGGICAGIIGALLWAVITTATGYQIGFMAIGIGAMVGLATGYFGKGIDLTFGLLGGVIALLSCVLGNFFSIIGAIATYEELGYLETLVLFDYAQAIPIMSETFSPMDILFYAIATFEGYKYAFRKLTEKELSQLSK
ncbi:MULTISPECIES: hypothetical protein [Cellulophaga]|uniref:Uncharacterized protein n=1 Tax=Cellulophaga baltica TaxID=76594 RepID=A0A1G7LQ73_9FLAO|nr:MULTISPECIES: hypothetical protein [Cellulophaga]AIY14106.1 hypothetical protein M667_13395 [Cellulophaga baltica NN016038]KGK28816.1 hypothetical protein EL45_18785 [Cellulophaga sp. E6(2014)]MBA6316339.1 hypothetical protein [Cellulophaga baltica]MCR1026709.1 hypothetical protein [Cellulophaga baltica]SDF51677.1 hypothetical protein SAMN04487992_12026 [Cellulophaga baltica]